MGSLIGNVSPTFGTGSTGRAFRRGAKWIAAGTALYVTAHELDRYRERTFMSDVQEPTPAPVQEVQEPSQPIRDLEYVFTRNGVEIVREVMALFMPLVRLGEIEVDDETLQSFEELQELANWMLFPYDLDATKNGVNGGN